MLLLIILWILQDLLTVLFGGVMQLPELFLMGIVYKLIAEEREDKLWAIWTAFFGGLLWDLRWVGVPGFFTLGYVAVVALILWAWRVIPVHGRTLWVVFLLLESSQFIPNLVPVLILGGSTGGSFFISQQIYALPALLICLYLYAKQAEQQE